MTARVAYLGIKGAFSEQAARDFFGDDLYDVQCQSFAEIFTAIETDQADYGILPVENSLAGTVSQSYELLTHHTAHIQGEIILYIEHALLALPNTSLADIEQVRSHPQALAQCAEFLRDNHLQPVEWYNTAGAAKDVLQDATQRIAAIASPRVGEMYGLQILARHIQDLPNNFTRFFALGKSPTERAEYNKTSLLFSVKDRSGVLVDCLLCFSRNNINLSKIESRPTRHQPWQYMFYVDLHGHVHDANFKGAIEALKQEAATVQILGSYPAAETPEVP